MRELRLRDRRGPQKDRWREFGRLTWRLLAVLQGRQRGRRSECGVTEEAGQNPQPGDREI